MIAGIQSPAAAIGANSGRPRPSSGAPFADKGHGKGVGPELSDAAALLLARVDDDTLPI